MVNMYNYTFTVILLGFVSGLAFMCIVQLYKSVNKIICKKEGI